MEQKVWSPCGAQDVVFAEVTNDEGLWRTNRGSISLDAGKAVARATALVRWALVFAMRTTPFVLDLKGATDVPAHAVSLEQRSATNSLL